jgi:hypothetical protein
MIDQADLDALSGAAADIDSRPRYRVVGDASTPEAETQPAPRPPVSECTFEALAYALRDGADALNSDWVQARLCRLASFQLEEICTRLRRNKSFCLAWPEGDIAKLISIYQFTTPPWD